MEEPSKLVQNVTDSFSQTIKNLTESLSPVMDKLAGTHSDLNLTFSDLELDTGTVKAKMTGSISLVFSYANQEKIPLQETSAETSEPKTVDRTVVDVE